MPRKLETVIDVNTCRAEAYATHFEMRQAGRHHPDRAMVERLVAALPKPSLNVFGAASIGGRSFAAWPTQGRDDYYSLGKRLGLDADALFYWYWSDAGWAAFEKLWAELPDSVHIPLCTSSKVVHIRTQPVFVGAPGRG